MMELQITLVTISVIFDFNTGILWRCYDDTITQLRGLSDNAYCVEPYPTSVKKSENN